MNARMSRFFASLAAGLGLAAMTSVAQAAPVVVDMTSLRAIQTYAMEDKADDQAFVLVTGIANGKEIEPTKLPKEAAWTIGPKSPVGDAKKPTALWTGDLAEGEFAVLTVTLFQGKGDDATIKAYAAKKAEAEKAVAARAAAKLTADEAKKLSTDLLKAHRDVVTKVKEVVGGRDKKTDHFGGQFTLVVWNNAGKFVKRIDPVGLTFGEHAGNDAKVYSKLKFTRANVLLKDEAGEWYEDQLIPLNDEEDAIRVKMLETEMVPVAGGKPTKNVTDYVAEIQVKVSGKAAKWKLGGEHLGESDLHQWWDFAE